MMNLNYLMDHILYQISKIVLSILSKNIKKYMTENNSIRIHVNQIENRIKFRIKIGYYLEF